MRELRHACDGEGTTKAGGLMLHAKVDLTLAYHPKAHQAGAAMATWTWGLLYSREQELDGFVPASALRLSWVGEAAATKHMASLVASGLVVVVDGGWRLLNYEAKNETKAQIDARRKADRDRKRPPKGIAPESSPTSTRTPHGFPPQGIPDSDSDSDSGSDPEGVQGEEPSAVRPSLVKYREAYCEGIREGTGSPYAWTNSRYDDEQLGTAIATFGRTRAGHAHRGDKLLAWIRAAASDFAEHVVALPPDQAKYWSHFGPKGFVRFLNQDRLTAEARRVG